MTIVGEVIRPLQQWSESKSTDSQSLVNCTSLQEAAKNRSVDAEYSQAPCAIDNSNDNHGITVNNIPALYNEDKFGAHQNNEKFKDINFNFSPTVEDNMLYQPNRDLDTAEIMIFVDIETGELHFDIVSLEELNFIDKDKLAVLASTFDPSVKFKYKDIFRQSVLDMSQSANCQTNHSPCFDNEILPPGRHPEVCEKIKEGVSPDKELNSVSRLSYLSGSPSGNSPGSGDCEVPRTVYCDDRRNYSNQGGSAFKQSDNRNDTVHDVAGKTRKSCHSGRELSKNWHNFHEKRSDNHCCYGNDYYRFSDRQFDNRYKQRHQKKEFSYKNKEPRHDLIKPRHVISFSESDLIYSSKRKMSDRHYKAPEIQMKKQITILKRGCTLKDERDKIMQNLGHGNHNQEPENQNGSFGGTESQADGGSVPYGNYSMTITSDRKYYSNKYTGQGEDTGIDKDLAETENWTTVKKQKKTKNQKGSKQKTKKPKKKVPKTQMEVLQSLIKAGQLKSVFSKWKTEALKRIKFVEELHNGTFAIKYKAIYNNEMVVLSVYIDQDTSDINAIDMVHLRNSKFIDGIRDCITGPYSSLWLLSRYYPNGDLQKLLFKDPDRRVIGEVHAQFVTASLIFAVDYLHQHGIVHGNIKPSKILISRNGFPVLTGYVIVDETILEERRDVYTPAYAAPERFRGHRGTAIDIFSVGCVGYEIVTGRTPFDDGNMNALRSNILDKSYRPLFEPELFSFAGEMFIDSCLRKSLKSRFTIGKYRENFLYEEWFSTLDLHQLERQSTYSPVLHAMTHIDTSKTVPLPLCEKTVEFDWGRALDITCPNLKPVDASELQSTADFLLQFF